MLRRWSVQTSLALKRTLWEKCAMLQFGEIDHVGLTVSDVDTALAFWEPFLGVCASARNRSGAPWLSDFTGVEGAEVEAAKLDLPAGGYIELYNYIVPNRARNHESTAAVGNVHFCLRVSDAPSAWRRAIELGAVEVTRNGPVTIGSGPSAGTRAGYLRIHDGITLELIQLAPSRDD